MSSLLRLSAGLGLALVLGACSPSGSGTALPSTEGFEALNHEGTPLFERMVTAPERVAYYGTRRVQLQLPRSGVLRSGSLIEEVATDGMGGFSVEVAAVESPTMSRFDRDAFITLMRERQPFVFRFRDLRIGDARLFLENYEVYELPDDRTVAGRDCLQFYVRKHYEPDTQITLAVDPETALILAYTESTFTGEDLVDMEFLTFHVGDHPAPPTLSSGLGATTIDPNSASTVLGFELLEPRQLPANFQRAATEVLDVDAGRFARQVYSDGLANIILLHRPTPTLTTIEGSGLNGRPAAGIIDVDSNADTVTVTEIGTWTVVDGRINGHEVIALGTGSRDDILDLLQSTTER